MRWLCQRLLCLSLACLALANTWAQGLLPVPALTERVIDQTGVLDSAGRQQVAQTLAQIEQQHGSQIVALLVPTTAPEDIAAYAWRVADTWKIGRKGIGDGIVIVVALQDRRMRIEVARALEGAIPDLMAKRIIDDIMTPAFRQGQFAQGLSLAASALGQLIAGEGLPAPYPNVARGHGEWSPELWLAALFFVFVLTRVLRDALGKGMGTVAAPVLGAGLAWWMTGLWVIAIIAAIFALIVATTFVATPTLLTGRKSGHLGAPWGGGGFGSGGGSGGGGFSSGGGGGFGGGGASGGW